ncbi:MAG: outer membrane protein assembly factor BamD [Oligoflexia bacterium]
MISQGFSEPLGHTTSRSLALIGALIAMALSPVWLISCSSIETQTEDPAALYKEAEDEIKNDHYLMATDKLRELKNKFPYSKYAIDAQLRLADVYFLQESYSEAAAAYETFRDLHPKHEKAAYALFRLGKSHLKDSPEEFARDQAPAERAIAAYSEFLAKYPADALAAEALSDRKLLEERLAEKEWRVGEFYQRRGYPTAAKRRYAGLAARFPKTTAGQRARKFLDAQANENTEGSGPEAKK